MSDNPQEPRNEPGWTGAFSRYQYPGAMPNGTRIVKVWGEPGDAHPIGARGTVLGSNGLGGTPMFYFVEWDDRPRVAIGCIAPKIARLEQDT